MYENKRWRDNRLSYLRGNPLCVICHVQGRLTPAYVVDHIKDHKGDYDLFWDTNNWQSLCASCHSSKTAKEN
jgi:5-methylcytosine-specific restriction protein A